MTRTDTSACAAWLLLLLLALLCETCTAAPLPPPPKTLTATAIVSPRDGGFAFYPNEPLPPLQCPPRGDASLVGSRAALQRLLPMPDVLVNRPTCERRGRDLAVSYAITPKQRPNNNNSSIDAARALLADGVHVCQKSRDFCDAFAQRARVVVRCLDADGGRSDACGGPPHLPRSPPPPNASPLPPPPPTGGGPCKLPNLSSQNGPWLNDVIAWAATPPTPASPVANLGAAGVPTLARLADGRLAAAYQNFPASPPADPCIFDKVAVRFSSDEGVTWTAAATINVSGMSDTGLMRPFDPTLVPLPDGRVRLYFTSAPATGGGTPAIYSAVSSDAVNYAFEPGVRFGVARRPVIDCAVARLTADGGTFHLFSPDNGAMTADNKSFVGAQDGVAYHAVSVDGLLFTRVADVELPQKPGTHFLGNVLEDTNGRLLFFGTGGNVTWPVESTDGGVTWSSVVAAVAVRGVAGADPGAARRADGSWLVVATSRRF